MDFLDHLKEYILTVHPVRRSGREKAEFRQWAVSELKRSGWKVKEETYGRTNGSVNVIAGDPNNATVFFCAHYDTASRMLFPNFVAPVNVAAHVGYHTTAALLLVAAALLLAFVVSFPVGQPALMLPLFIIVLLIFMAASVYGPANKENANCNSSGVLAVLALARVLKHDKRICLLLLDNNDKNCLGAKAFAKKHPNAEHNCLFFNLDCVGDGENMLFMPSKRSRWDGELLKDLESSFGTTETVKGKTISEGFVYYPSDHKPFRFHVAVCACRYKPVWGYYIPNLWTKKDKVLALANVRYLVEGSEKFLELYLDREEREAE